MKASKWLMGAMALTMAAGIAGCTVYEDDKPDTTIVKPDDKPDIIITPPATDNKPN